MNHYAHLAKARDQIEEENLITVGQATIVYNATARVWALPGGMTTTHRPAAERAAELIDLMMSGQLSGPRVATQGGRRA